MLNQVGIFSDFARISHYYVSKTSGVSDAQCYKWYSIAPSVLSLNITKFFKNWL